MVGFKLLQGNDAPIAIRHSGIRQSEGFDDLLVAASDSVLEKRTRQ